MTTATVLPRTGTNHNVGLVAVDGRTYPLKSAAVSGRAEGGIAATTLSQTYENPYAETLEVLYTLPLPADAAVTRYTVRLGKRVIRGEVRKRDEAREEYRKALFEGRTAALLEQERADTFSQRLGSLPPGETATIEIEVLQPLAFLPGTGNGHPSWEYRFPTVVGVRYEGGKNRVPDAEKLDVNRASSGTPLRLAASLQIADGPEETVQPRSPDQRIHVQTDGHGTLVTLDNEMRLDRDLVIRWSAGKQETGVRAAEGKGLPCDSGRYLLITLTPPSAAGPAIPRDLTLLIDASGSMSGEPLEQAKAVAIELLRSLDPGDRFEILAFSEKVRRLVAGPVDACAKFIDRACRELGKLKASGATEMTKALIESLKPLRKDSQRQVILLSDGYIGFEQEVIGEIARKLVPGARIHTVGVGSAPNRTLTRGAARAGRGIEIVIGLEDNARQAAERLLQATVRPVLTDIRIQGPAIVCCAPQKPRDVLAGQPALIFAEVKDEGGRIEISGRTAGKSPDWIECLEIPPAKRLSPEAPGLETTPIPIGALFGREAIEDAEIDLATGGGQPGEIDKKIERLGLRHGISSRMTSLIAISEDPTVDPRNPRRRERLPVEVPGGISAEGVGLGPIPLAFEDMAAVSEPRLRPARGMFRKVLESAMLLDRPRFSGAITIDRARVLRIDGPTLVFEFETPVDGFILPDEYTTITVTFDDGAETCVAEALEDESSGPGPYAAGLTIRLALRLQGRANWHHEAASIQWRVQPTPGAAIAGVKVNVHFLLGTEV